MDRKDRFAGLGVLLAALLMATAQTGSKANQVNFGSQGIEREFRNAVEIGNDSGGYVAEYALRLYEMKEARQRVRFVGVCNSACTLFLALPAEQTCITESAYFRFHFSLGAVGVRRRGGGSLYDAQVSAMGARLDCRSRRTIRSARDDELRVCSEFHPNL